MLDSILTHSNIVKLYLVKPVTVLFLELERPDICIAMQEVGKNKGTIDIVEMLWSDMRT